MKLRIALALSAIAALVITTGCDKKLDTDQRKASYAIGQQISNNLKSQNIDYDPAVVGMALKDVKEGKASRMKPEEMQAALQKLQEDINKKQSEAANKNLENAKAFLEQNKAKEGVKTLPSGLQMIIVSEGKGKTPSLKDTVKAHYKGTLVTGETFDSSYDRGQPAEFPLAGVIKGWQEGLQHLKVGGKAKLFVPPELGYGPSARPGIPANSVLVFDVELLDVKAGK